MRKLGFLVSTTLLLVASVAVAQVDLPDRNSLTNGINSAIGQGGSATGQGNSDINGLLDGYKRQLSQGMPCVNGGSGCSAPDPSSPSLGTTSGGGNNSGTTSGGGGNSGTTTGSTTGSKNSGNNQSTGGTSASSGNNSSGATNGGTSSSSSSGSNSSGTNTSGTTSTNSAGNSGSTPSAGTITRDQLQGAILKAIKKQVNSTSSLQDLKSLTSYLKAMGMIWDIYNSGQAGADRINDVIGMLSSGNSAAVRQELGDMLKSNRGLNTLSAANQNKSTKQLGEMIDDVKEGSRKLKSYMRKVHEDMRAAYYKAQSNDDKNRIALAMKRLTADMSSGMPQAVMNGSLSAFKLNGRFVNVPGEILAETFHEPNSLVDLAEGDLQAAPSIADLTEE